MKYARYDIILQEKEVNEDLLIRIDNSEASGAIPLELLSHDRKEKVSGYMNFQGAKALGYNLSNKELLDKLAEYKPLAKVEELTEQNYNMIDNVLNNGAEKKEQEQIKGRISIKEKLAEKKAVIEQRDKAERTSPEKETEKKSQREM